MEYFIQHDKVTMVTIITSSNRPSTLFLLRLQPSYQSLNPKPSYIHLIPYHPLRRQSAPYHPTNPLCNDLRLVDAVDDCLVPEVRVQRRHVKALKKITAIKL